ncbi:hypothetical protein [Nocardia vinacea]|uniref:hypothetical protein n=1 Tax=Nocardia vinacea TaxID=96468 RepID=UPI0012F63431|nr:hypothetical protein [Nocardia vinacea]
MNQRDHVVKVGHECLPSGEAGLNLLFMTAAFDDMDLRDLVGLLTEDELRELRPAVLRVLSRQTPQELLRRELGLRMAKV